MTNSPILLESRRRLQHLITKFGFKDGHVRVETKTLSPVEAIGNPRRQDFPIIEGKERLVEARVLGVRAHAFTDAAPHFVGRLDTVLNMPLNTNGERAIYLAALNGVLKALGLVEGTLHCKDDEPELCAKSMANFLSEIPEIRTLGVVGFNPAIIEALTQEFGPDSIRVTDLNKKNIGTYRFEVPIWDGKKDTLKLIKFSDALLVTGTTLVNGTFDGIVGEINQYKKNYYVYGVTAAGFCELFGITRLCFKGRD
jgi:uncharacterized protein (DUF4213/DUF364 family)